MSHDTGRPCAPQVTTEMMERLTKSESPGVNAFFSVSLITSLASFVIAPAWAWLRQSDITSAVGSSVVSFLLWWVMLGIYRLSKG